MFFPGMNSPNSSTMKDEDDSSKHNQDVVMPGFRFHPTEEELVEFYLRRKVEGKHFNIELITSVDLYRYDPWELPALAAIGEKEWFFYVPRDRKYRNGDRPNRVTASGYWKATGADRMIRNENFSCIGLKKTLVFYRGKAPKGKRTSWIMNEYRLPQLETERIQKNELSLCRVYKKAGTDLESKESRNLSVKADENRDSSLAAITRSYKEGNSSVGNAYCNVKRNTDEEIVKLEQLPSSSQTCVNGDIETKRKERFPVHMEYGIAELESMNILQQRIFSEGTVNENVWSVSRPMVLSEGQDDVEMSLTKCLFPARPPQQPPFPMVEDLYNTPSHLLVANANTNTLTYNAGLPTYYDKLWDWNPVRNNGGP